VAGIDTMTGLDSVTDLDAVIFDFDGLIADTETPQYRTVADTFADHGVELALADWQAIIGTADHPHWSDWLADALGERAAEVDFDDVRATKLATYHALLEDLQPLPGIVDLLDEAAEHQVDVAVASSSPLAWVDGHLTRFGLRDRFSSVHTRDHVARTKPAPDLFLLAVETLGIDPARGVVLEDSPHGVTAAKAAGLAVVACPNDITRGLSFAHADLVVESLADITLFDLAALGRPA
jgi:HAD superfamily hydrolase (TIGR01509 family)